MSTMPSLCGAALLTAVLASAPALAQSAGSPAAQPAAPPPSAAGPAADQAAAARVEARIKQLHTQLQITPAEDAQWTQFAQIMRENARDMGEAAAQRAAQFATMNAVDDMKSYEQLAEAHVQRLQKLIPAFEALYNAMSTEQKQIADRVFRGGAERHAQAPGGRK
jgi:periplasmic protein CpxP/Spy